MKPKSDRLAARREQVAERLLMGNTYRQIAKDLNLRSTKPVSDDIAALIAEWRREQTRSIDEWVTVELAKVARIEAEAWAGWQASQKDAETVSTETLQVVLGRTKKGVEVPAVQTRTTRTVKGQAGDPRFLDTILKCVVRRCDLLGLDKPRKLDLGNGTVVFLMPDNGRGNATPSPRS